MALAEQYFGDPETLEKDLVLQIQDAVRAALKRKRWNQNDLAYRMGVDRRSLSTMLRRGSGMRVGSVARMGEALGLQPVFAFR